MHQSRRRLLDESKVQDGFRPGFLGAVVECRSFQGAVLSRVMHPPGQSIDAHHHDWPTLVLCRLGAYRETGEAVSAELDGPAVIFQPRGVEHADHIGDRGLETLALMFDPRWLRSADLDLPEAITWRTRGLAAVAANDAARVWLDCASSETDAIGATTRLLEALLRPDEQASAPRWASQVERMVADAVATRDMADKLSRHPAWLTRAYRAWRGEGIADVIRRARVELAVDLLRNSDLGLAAIAADCGFCDQGHMTRVFSRSLGRTPGYVRTEASLLRAI